MDGFYTDTAKGNKTVAFLTADQAALYGGYAEAMRILKVDAIRPPIMICDHWNDFSEDSTVREVGHA